jgi:WD40 repeat protein
LAATLKGHEVPVTSVAFSPDGRTLATGDGESYTVTPDGRAMDTWSLAGQVKLWDVAQRTLSETLNFPKPVSGLGFSPDGHVLATGCKDGKVRLWDAQTARPRGEFAAFSNFVSALAFAPDGLTLAVAGTERGPNEIGDVKLYDVTGWAERAILVGHQNTINTMAFTPDGKTLATGAWDGTIRMWDPQLALERFALRTAQVNAVAFSRDGKLLVSGNTSQTVSLWRAASEQEVLARDAQVHARTH